MLTNHSAYKNNSKLKKAKKKKKHKKNKKNIVSSEYIANVTGHGGINFLNDYNEADEEEGP